MTREELLRRVARRAKGRCEYCKLSDQFQLAAFHLDHCVPASHGGSDLLANRCYSCPRCNLRKSSKLRLTDSLNLFNPRTQHWHDHFWWNGLVIEPKTNLGIAMITYFTFNSRKRIEIRRVEMWHGLHPPPEES